MSQPTSAPSTNPVSGAGVVLSALNPKNLLLIVAGMAAIAQTGIPAGEQAVTLAVFTLIASIGVAAPVVIYFALGDRSRELLDRLKSWMAQNNAVIMAVLLLVIGVKLIGDAIAGFQHLTHRRRRASSGTGLLKPQHEFLDFAGACFSEASFSRDDAKAALLEDAEGRDVVTGNACVEWARRINRQERLESVGCNPLAPVGPADPVCDFALVGIAPRPNRSGDFAVDDDDSGKHRLVGS